MEALKELMEQLEALQGGAALARIGEFAVLSMVALLLIFQARFSLLLYRQAWVDKASGNSLLGNWLKSLITVSIAQIILISFF